MVERVVAVVEEKPILWSQVRTKAQPDWIRAMISGTVSSQTEGEVYRASLQRLLEESLFTLSADKAGVSVSEEEVSRALQDISTRAGLTLERLFAEVARMGLTEKGYKEELSHQLLEGKLLQLQVRSRIRPTKQDALASLVEWVRELKGVPLLHVRILALRIAPDATPEERDKRLAFANTLADEARAGADFCTLVQTYSEDTDTKALCGSRGFQPQNLLLPAIQSAVESLQKGEFSPPLVIEGEAILLVHMLDRLLLDAAGHVDLQACKEAYAVTPSLQQEMQTRAFEKKMQQARARWIQDLRTTYAVREL